MNKEFFARLPRVPGAHFWILSQKGELLVSQDTLPLEDGDKATTPPSSRPSSSDGATAARLVDNA
jgi:hypothetical protein